MITDEQRAIEFAEYMAKSAESFMRAVNRLQNALDEEVEDIGDAEQSLSEYWSDLESSIYEFRKRAAIVTPNAKSNPRSAAESG